MTAYPSSLRGLFADSRRVRWSWPLLAIVVGLPILFPIWLLTAPGGEDARLWFDDIALTVGAVAAALTSAVAARRYAGTPTGRAWLLICAGLVMVSFGEIAWGVQELVLRVDEPFPSVADIGYLGLYPAVFLGLLIMPQAPVASLRRVKLGLDVLIALAAAGLISWHFVIQPFLSENGASTLADIISVAYPLCDLAIVFAVITLIARGGRSMSTAGLALLAGGFLAIAGSDTLYAYLTQVGDYNSGSYIDTGWIIGYSLLALSASAAAGRRLNLDTFPSDQEQTGSLWQAVAMYLPVIPLTALLFVDMSTSDAGGRVFMMAGFIGVAGLMFARQLLTIHENVQLNHRLEAMTAELTDKVKAQTLRLLQR